MKTFGIAFGLTSALAIMLAPLQVAKANTISTGAACSLVDAIDSANTNAAVGGCGAGSAGPDAIIVTQDVQLSVANNVSGVDNGSNGLPIIIEDLLITSAGPGITRIVSRSTAGGTPEFRFLEIGTDAVPAALTLSGIHMTNGRVTATIGAAGGCIYLRNGSLTIADSTLEECVAQGNDNATGTAGSGKGGAIFAINGTLEITNSAFSFNSARAGATTLDGAIGAVAEGGAIYASDITSFVLENTTMFSNFAIGGAGVSSAGTAKGGGVMFFGDIGTMTGTAFVANASSGGAASAPDGNSGFSLGGAIAVQGADLTITDTDLTGNVVNGPDNLQGTGGYAFGGAIFTTGGTLDIEESAVSGNQATGGAGVSAIAEGIARGGGLYLIDTTATIDDSSIERNSISGYNPKGGGIAIVDASAAASPVLIAHSTIEFNSAVSSASASADGGGIYQERDSLTIRNTTLSDNVADAGGGLFQDSGTTIVALSTFSANTANNEGGAIAVDSPNLLGHTMVLKNVTISGNFAGAIAGGLYITGSPLAPEITNVSLHNVVVTNNTNGGIHLAEDHTQPVLVSGNSIIGAQASGADCSADGAVIFTSEGGNLESATSCAFTAASDQQSVADLALNVLGNYGGETLTHDLLPDSPAIDAGRKRICNRQADKKDQRGLARFYDGNGDRSFECDSGPVEYQGLLANPGFEEPLDSAGDWTLTASGGGDARARVVTAPSGKFAFMFQANAALETLSQTRPIAGGAGETYRLTMLGQGSGLTVGEEMTIALTSTNGGATVDTRTCRFSFPAAAFSGPPGACTLNTTGAFDAINVAVGWDGATTGTLTLDALSLTQR